MMISENVLGILSFLQVETEDGKFMHAIIE
jgi:hypothetical protein